MAKTVRQAARDALAATGWSRIDAMTDEDLARPFAANPDSAPDMAPAQFADTDEISNRTVQSWKPSAKKPSVPARTLVRAIRTDRRAGERPRPIMMRTMSAP